MENHGLLCSAISDLNETVVFKHDTGLTEVDLKTC